MKSATSEQSLIPPASNRQLSTQSDQEVLVRVDGVSKKFCRSLKKSLWYGVKDILSEFNPFSSTVQGDGLRQGEFWSVNDVSFELRRGECLGLIGRNGAGKTTLLKMLNGLIKPDRGRIEMRGRVGALIALGAGFNPILTGRENIYVNGAVLGLSKRKIDAKIEGIIDFADIREFIDSPVQNYSSGMQVRLGFAVATALEPDILLLDEVLAVGDAAFRAKCYNKIGEMQRRAAVIFVSHSMQQISQVCSSILYLRAGQTKWLGDVPHGVAAYMCENAQSSAGGERTRSIQLPVQSALLMFTPTNLHFGECLTARLELKLESAMPDSSIRIPFYNPEGLVVAEWNSKRAGIRVDLVAGKNSLEIKLGPLHLGPGTYEIALVLNDATGVFLPFWSLKQHSFIVQGNIVGSCEYQIPHLDFHVSREPQWKL